jgi:basic membrane lipoprotein Med (substrate-binding protein (PBP1-ABC) superfamily)
MKKTKWTRRFIFAVTILVALCLAVPGAPGRAVAAKAHKFAMILPGPIEDADYNFRGYQVSQDIKKRFSIETSYSERISPADAERVAREYIASGYTIVGFHGGQYIRIVKKLAPKFPEINFIMESSGRGKVPKNVWNVHRKFFEAFYPFGVLAGLATKTNKVGVIAGIQLPDFKSSINSISDALKVTNPKAELVYSFTGNQNDPAKARQTAEAMIANGVDFIINMVNLGVYGVVEAAKKAKHKVLLTTFYTDKTDKAPKNFAGTLYIDFRPPFATAVGGILKGSRTGWVPMRPGNGFELKSLGNVSAEAIAKTKEAFEKVRTGSIKPRLEMKKVRLAK